MLYIERNTSTQFISYHQTEDIKFKRYFSYLLYYIFFLYIFFKKIKYKKCFYYLNLNIFIAYL